MLREVISNEWLTVLFVLNITLITIVKYIHSVRFSDFLLLLFNSNYIKIYANERRLLDNFNLLLIINYVLSVSIFILLVYNQFVNPLEFDILLFLKIVGAVIIFIFFKIFLEKILGWIFDIAPVINNYITEKMNLRTFMGLLLIPINILFVFSIQPSTQAFNIAFIILSIICLLIFVNVIKTNLKLVFRNTFYFILYLCALEIAPYIILYKLINNI